MRLKVEYSLKHEIDNYVNALYEFKWHKHGRKQLQEKLLAPFPDWFKTELKNAKSPEDARKIVKKLKDQQVNSKKYKQVAENLEREWDKSDHLIIKKLEKTYGKPVPFQKLTVFLTSIPICPYNFKEKWIMMFVNTNVEKQLAIILHELNHFMFYHYFSDLRKELDHEKYESLKESLTILTNPTEKGYPNQENLRQWLKKQKGTVKEILLKKGWQDLV